MVELSNICGLPIYLDEETGDISYGQEVVCAESRQVVLSDLIPVLLNKYLRYPEHIYKLFRNVVLTDDTEYNHGDLSYNIVKIPYGLLGVEYIKTHIYFTKFQANKYSCVVEVISGELTVLIQKNSSEQEEFSMNTSVDDVHIITLEKGERLAMPTGVFYTFVNAGQTHVVFAIVTAFGHSEVDYKMIQKEKGLAFYIISKNAKIEIVANPKYKVINRVINKKWEDLDEGVKSKYRISQNQDLSEPLYNYFKEKKNVLEEVMA